MTMRRLLLLVVTWTCVLAGFARAGAGDDHWPQWRGPFGTGVARGGAPLQWSDAENVAWRVAIPGRGFSTPIAWGERIFLTTAVPTGAEAKEGAQEEHAFIVLCLERGSGEVLWERTVRVGTPHEGFHKTYGSFASISPVTDGERVYASFGSFGIYCLDFDGELVWKKDLGVQMNMRRDFGEGATPALSGDVLVHLFDQEGDSFALALDKRDGKELWRVPRDEGSTWAMPLLLEREGVRQAVTTGTKRVRSYALETGKLLWECAGLGSNPIPVPVRHEDTVIVASGHRDPAILAIGLGGKGDLSGTEAVRWSSHQGCPYTASPVLCDGRLYTATDRGFLSCFDAATGKPFYVEERLPRGSQLKSSPVAADGCLYIPTESGAVHVVKLGEKYEVLATNDLADQFFVASPIVVDGRLYLRSSTELICIAEPPAGGR